MRQSVLLLRVATASALALACGHAPPRDAPSRESAGPAVNGILLRGGTLVLAGHDTAIADIVLERSANRLTVRAISTRANLVVTDTADLSGLFIHTANLSASPVIVGADAMYVIRTGTSPGTPAVGLLWPGDAAVRPVDLDANYPAGPADTRVGCYDVSQPVWNDSAAAAQLARRIAVPETVQLHWQYLWHIAREHYLVATNAHGNVPGERIALHAWWPVTEDSARITFSTGHEAAVFLVGRDGTELVGEVRISGHTVPGPVARSPVRLRPTQCYN